MSLKTTAEGCLLNALITCWSNIAASSTDKELGSRGYNYKQNENKVLMHYNTEKQFIIRVLSLDDLTKLSGFQITIYMLTTSQIIFLLSSLFWILESYPTSSLNCMANRNLKLTCPKQYWFTSPCPQTLSSHLFFPIISPIAISGNTLYSVGQVPKLQITLSSSHKPTNNRPSRLDNFTSKIYFF